MREVLSRKAASALGLSLHADMAFQHRDRQDRLDMGALNQEKLKIAMPSAFKTLACHKGTCYLGHRKG